MKKLSLFWLFLFLSSCALSQESDHYPRSVQETSKPETQLKERDNFQLSVRDWSGTPEERQPGSSGVPVKVEKNQRPLLRQARQPRGSWNDQLRAQNYGINKRLSANKLKAGQRYPFYNVSQAFPDVQKIRFATESSKPQNLINPTNAGEMRELLYGISDFTRKNLARFRTENRAVKAPISEQEARQQKIEAKAVQESKAISAAMDDSYEGNDFRTSAYDFVAFENQWLFFAQGEGVQHDDDWYKVYVTPLFRNLVLDLRFQHYYGDIDMQLFNTQGELVASSASIKDDEYINVILEKPGTYFVRIYYSNRGNNYDLKWSTAFTGSADDIYEENDSLKKAYDLRGKEKTWLYSVKGEAVAGDDDYFLIKAESGYQRLLVDCRFLQSQGDVELALYDEAGHRLASSTATGDDELIDFVVSHPGHYYVRVYAFGKALNNYDLRWWSLKTLAPAPEDQFEPNDILAQGTCDAKGTCVDGNPLLAENDKVKGTQYDEDWFRILANKSNHIQADLNFLSDGGEIYLGLYNAQGQLLTESHARKDNQHIDFIVPDLNKNYFIRVYGDNAGNAYELSWRSVQAIFAEDQYEPNQTIENAYELMENVWLSEMMGLGQQNDTDFYKVRVSSNSFLQIDLRSRAKQGKSHFELWNVKGDRLAFSRHIQDDEWVGINLPSGDYFVKVDGVNKGAPYDLKWSAEPLSSVSLKDNQWQEWVTDKSSLLKIKAFTQPSGVKELELLWPEKNLKGQGLLRGAVAELSLTTDRSPSSLAAATFELTAENKAVLTWAGYPRPEDVARFELKTATTKASRPGADKP